VYLNQSAHAAFTSVVRSVDVKPTSLVFAGITRDRVSVAFGRLCRKLNIANFRFHDLRHTAASWMRMRGADIHTVAQLLGHKDLRMATRYQHLSPAFLAKAVESLDEVFGVPRYQSVTETGQLTEGVTVND
jgi:integrase